MSGSYAQCGWLLLWGFFQSTEVAGQGECAAPIAIDYAGFFAERYAIGTHVRYVCEKGYSRKAGESNLVKCSNVSGHAEWTYRLPPACRAQPTLIQPLSEQPPTEKRGSSNGSQTMARPVMEEFCGAPRPLKHAKAEVKRYPVGQELHYQCLDGHRARTPIYEVCTCENNNGKGVWSRLTLQCTNSSKVTGGAMRELLSAAVFSVTIMTTAIIL